jgi:hypothetical protein
MTADLKAAVQKCPDQKIVLLGYSQGGEFSLFSPWWWLEKLGLSSESCVLSRADKTGFS